MTCCVVQKLTLMGYAVLNILFGGNTRLPTVPASCARVVGGSDVTLLGISHRNVCRFRRHVAH